MPEEDFHKEPTISALPPGEKLPPATIEIPKMVGPYKIESLLEKGGMSIIYLATHPNTKEPTTIKVLSPRYITSPEAIQRFLNEAEIIAMTDHPNIVKLFGHGEWEGGLYIAMEFIQGISLRQAILQNPISLKRALEIIIDVAYALCHLHTHGVIHRDLKPENILVTESNQIKVIDFGIAQLLTEKASNGSPPKQRLIGTPIYMSPEQRENPESVSYPSDIYSLGIIAYELVLGKLSHGQIHLSLMPKGLQKILNKALQLRPQDRYQDIVDFITDVSAYLNSPNIQKEKKGGDALSELSENLKLAQSVLAPAKLPAWPNLELGLATQKVMNAYGIYYDFFYEKESFGILMGESSAKGAEGIVHASMLRGMIRAINPLDYQPAEFITKLNSLITADTIEHAVTLTYLSLCLKDNSLTYLSCGYGNLWKISASSGAAVKLSANNIGLGIDEEAEFRAISAPWEIGDLLVLNSFAADFSEAAFQAVLDEDLFKKSFQEESKSIPQKIVEAILRKVSIALAKNPPERTLTLIGILRKK